jgi:hypothetical protein
MGADEQARLLTRTNPARILADEAPLPVAGIPKTRGMLGRLRELVFGPRR